MAQPRLSAVADKHRKDFLMSASPDVPAHFSRNGGQQASPGNSKAVEPEILGPNTHSGERQHFSSQASAGAGHGHDGAFRTRHFGPHAGLSFQTSGCLPFFVTFALFLVCLTKFGLLAGIGFLFFHTVGSIAGVLHALRLFGRGQDPGARWAWRLGNWAISLALTAWLAG